MRTRYLASLALALLVLAGVRAVVAPTAAAPPDVLVNRVWIERMPASATDFVHVLMIDQLGGERIGFVQRASTWEGTHALFEWSRPRDGALTVRFPQDQSKYDVTYAANACDEAGFDYCLTVRGLPKAVNRYFSRKGWEIPDDSSQADADAMIDRWITAR
jgi:hypothetical protein